MLSYLTDFTVKTIIILLILNNFFRQIYDKILFQLTYTICFINGLKVFEIIFNTKHKTELNGQEHCFEILSETLYQQQKCHNLYHFC